jgi:inner membrane protein
MITKKIMKDKLSQGIGVFRNWIRHSVLLKIAFMGILVFILMIPTFFVRGLIYNREYRQADAVREVTQKWGGSQSIEGPVVSIPYLKWPNANKSEPSQVGHLHVLPDVLHINANLEPEVRSRGIFDVPLYKSQLHITGSFSTDDLDFPVSNRQVLWNDAKIIIGISDMRGLKEHVKINFNEEEILMTSGLSRSDIFRSGVQTLVPGFSDSDSSTFSMDLNLNGGQEIRFVPMGKETKVKLTSSWENPSFDGAFLPTDHTISEEGFEARWSVLDINRNYPQRWLNENYRVAGSHFGVDLFMPVDNYQKTTRSVKYALLFIALTFLAFFLSEILNNLRIHPIQYLLIGFAIVLFYLLLLSLSEHIDFNKAYGIASVGIVAMVSLYSGSEKLGILIGALLALLYLFLYFLLQMEDFALLLGSIGLFVILGAVMYLTRNFDWYSMRKRD